MQRLLLLLAVAAWPQGQEPSREPPLALAHKDARVEWGACPEFIGEGCRLAVLHGDPARPNADVFLKVPAGHVIPRHFHSSNERMVLVSGRLSVTYDGHAPLTMTPGTYGYAPARMSHEAVCAQGAPCVLFIAFEQPVDAVPTGPAANAPSR